MVDSDQAGPSSAEWRRVALLALLDDSESWKTGAVVGPKFTHLSWLAPNETRYTVFRMYGGDMLVIERSGLLPEHLDLPGWSTHPAVVRETVHTLIDWALDAWAAEFGIR